MSFPRGWELLIILAVFVIFFGYKKLPNIATGFAKGIKNFKKGMSDPLDDKDSNGKDDE